METKQYFLPYDRMSALIDALYHAGYSCIGPQVRDGSIVYEPLTKVEQLPWGVRDHQSPGQYQLEKTDEQKAFGFSNGAMAIKPILFKPQETVWKVIRNAEGQLEFIPHHPQEKPIAILGARACDLAAMNIQDKVFLSDKQNPDPRYLMRRQNLLIVAVQCGYSSNNCFCVSAGTGPEITNSYDILMTEIQQGFVIQSGSERGTLIVDALGLNEAHPTQIQKTVEVVQQAVDMQTKQIPLNNSYALRELLFNNLEHPRWAEVAERCLSCGNCTQVCPTCFCHSETEAPNLEGTGSEHQREWDSCFTEGHSVVNKKVLRDDTRKRYRQWLTHKVGSWFDQFDVSGCVGCGRCISWCPVGIDITEELSAISGESNERKR